MNPSYGITRDLPQTDYEDAIEKVTTALKDHGFGILTEIDVKATLKKKLDVDVPPYIILGACNPPFAHQALAAEPGIGLLLPCNVVVAQREGGGSTISAIDPVKAFALVERENLAPLAEQVRAKLRTALDSL